MKIPSIFSGQIMLLSMLVLLITGCAKQHSISANNDTLLVHYRDSEARQVILAASLDNFRYHIARKEHDDLWVVHLPLQEQFSYFYIVDGQVKLPECRNTVLDDFGGKNCLYVPTM